MKDEAELNVNKAYKDLDDFFETGGDPFKKKDKKFLGGSMAEEGQVRTGIREFLKKEYKNGRINLDKKDIERVMKYSGLSEDDPILVFKKLYGDEAYKKAGTFPGAFDIGENYNQYEEIFRKNMGEDILKVKDSKYAGDGKLVLSESEEVRTPIKDEDVPFATGGRASFAGGKVIDEIVLMITKKEPVEAMKEVNKVLGKKGKYKNLTQKDIDRIVDQTEDHIFQRDPDNLFVEDRPMFKKETDIDLEDVDLSQGMIDLDELNFTKNAKAAKETIDNTSVNKEIKEGVAEILSDTSPAALEASIEIDNLMLKYPGMDKLLARQIATDTNPKRKADVIAMVEQTFELDKQGKSGSEIIDIFKNTKRTKQADGGITQLRKGYVEGGPIYPRLGELSSGVSSAEEQLQQINQSLKTAETNLGESGPGGAGSVTPSVNGYESSGSSLYNESPAGEVNNPYQAPVGMDNKGMVNQIASPTITAPTNPYDYGEGLGGLLGEGGQDPVRQASQNDPFSQLQSAGGNPYAPPNRVNDMMQNDPRFQVNGGLRNSPIQNPQPQQPEVTGIMSGYQDFANKTYGDKANNFISTADTREYTLPDGTTGSGSSTSIGRINDYLKSIGQPGVTFNNNFNVGLLQGFAPGVDPMGSRKENPTGPLQQLAQGGRAGYYMGGQAMVGEDLSDIGHGSDSLMARNMQVAPGSQATTSTGLNYLLGQDNDTARVPYKDAGPVVLPKKKPTNDFKSLLKIYNTYKDSMPGVSEDTQKYLAQDFINKLNEKGLSQTQFQTLRMQNHYEESKADGGRIEFGGGGSMGASDKGYQGGGRDTKGSVSGTAPGAAPSGGGGSDDRSSPEQKINHFIAMNNAQQPKTSKLKNMYNTGSELNYLKNIYKMDPIGLGISYGIKRYGPGVMEKLKGLFSEAELEEENMKMTELTEPQLGYLNSKKTQRDLKEGFLSPQQIYDKLPSYEEKTPLNPFKGDQEPTSPKEFNEYLDTIDKNKFLERITVAEGGIAGLRKGYAGGKGVDAARRGFLKILGGSVAAATAFKMGLVKMLGKESGAVSKKAVDEFFASGTSGAPSWFEPLVNKALKEGLDITEKAAIKDGQIVKQLDTPTGKVDVTYDTRTGAVDVDYMGGDTAMGEGLQMRYAPGDIIEEGAKKGQKSDDVFEAVESIPEFQGGNYMDGPDLGFGENMTSNIDDLYSDTSELATLGGEKLLVKDISNTLKKKKVLKEMDNNPQEFAQDMSPDVYYDD